MSENIVRRQKLTTRCKGRGRGHGSCNEERSTKGDRAGSEHEWQRAFVDSDESGRAPVHFHPGRPNMKLRRHCSTAARGSDGGASPHIVETEGSRDDEIQNKLSGSTSGLTATRLPPS